MAQHFDAIVVGTGPAGSTVARELIGPMATRIMESAQDLGHDWRPLPKLILQDNCRANCEKCVYGCPYGAKWSGREFAEEAVRGGATLWTGARVKRVLVEAGRATGVVISRRLRTEQVHADRVVVSAGGIGTPEVLRASGIHEAGKDLFFDPLIAVFGEVDGLEGGREVSMAAGHHFAEDGYLMSDMTMPMAGYITLAAHALRPDRVAAHGRTLTVMVKIRDDLGGRIGRGGIVMKSLTAADHDRLEHGHQRARAILERAGARRIFKSQVVASHPGGTAKIGDVVDTDLKTRIDGLYVCDCSVIPEPWGLPPTLSLICLGKRLAKHLAGVSAETAAASA